ncbi:SRPBCC family protein [Psychromicrobium lacuslunae]|uniref:Cyclase n=1 Tax=Psychromicrobium lacuslunae TaxID=1618207 RepID=A0A0D4BX88_9MICC|nr:SRPBCC family protein [Psychromicrobium lacuslunae]AJT40740.1 cyclase [Psychromicrobium lacuslunae]
MSFVVTLRNESTLAQADLFDASLSIDAHLESMSASDEKAIAGVTQGKIALGETVTWRAKHFGIWWTMTSKIVELDAPHHFIDEQQRGPFKRFRHLHQFETQGAVTVMTDTLTVTAPCGVLGLIAEKLFLKSYLRKLIEQRNRYLLGA